MKKRSYKDRRKQLSHNIFFKFLRYIGIERRKNGERRSDWVRCSPWCSIYAPRNV